MPALLSPQNDELISRFAWLGRPVGAPKAKHLLALLDKLAFVRSFPVQSNLRAFLPQSRLDHLAEEARRLSASHLGDVEPQRRRATLMAYLFDLSETLTAAVLDMHDRVMMGLLGDGEREAAEAFGQQGPLSSSSSAPSGRSVRPSSPRGNRGPTPTKPLRPL